MNPYDPNMHPGTHLVSETLGVSEFSALNTTHHHGGPLHQATTRMVGAAYELDKWHDRVTVTAKDALRLLEPVGRGELGGARVSYAILRTTVPKLGELLTQQDRAYDQLFEAISAYQLLLPSTERSAAKTPEPNREQGFSRDDGWAIAGDRQLTALQAVEAGGLRVRLTGIGDDPYLSDGTDRRPQPLAATIQRLVADGLLHQDTSENPYRPGQLLSLTPQGETALRDARTAPPRVSAALRRSNNPAGPGPLADSTAAPVATALGQPSRTR
ncbi:large ATP-binding protein [Streptomyces sp. NPDC006175]|uniref:large ATP-binding protein n=1 Tax=unclassified Streptomyces TaxID=2593676 RepID=UPI0033B18275